VRSPEYVKELVTHHVGGYLKIAPEHTQEGPLSKMMKPGIGAYERFKQMFDRFSKEAGKEQYLIPYFIAAHPGTTDEDMLELALWLKRNGFRLDQVQTFLPTPLALATAMWHTEKNPLRKVAPGSENVAVVRGARQRKLHKAFLRWHDAENWPLLRDALKTMGRADLIGPGKRHLVPAWQPAGTGAASLAHGERAHTAESRQKSALAARRPTPAAPAKPGKAAPARRHPDVPNASWSPAAPAFSARTFASACSPKATTSSAPTTSSPAPRTTSAPAGQPALRADAPRRHLPALCRSGRNLQPGLPRLAHALPARSGADHQDQRAWRDQHAGPGQARQGQDPAGIHQRGLRRPGSAPAGRGYWGNVNPIGIRSCYDEGKRCAETLFFDYHRQHKLRIKVARIFNTYGPRMHPNDGRVVQLHRPGAEGRSHHRLWRRPADALLLLRRRPGRRPAAPDEFPRRIHRPGQPRQPGRIHHPRTTLDDGLPRAIDYFRRIAAC
jgi:hypothetical protein